MSKIDFISYASELAKQDSRRAMRPVIEKEIIHYELLNQLDTMGLLEKMAFRGGTCLRLCFDGIRYSEDLDFAAGSAYASIDLEEVAARLKAAMERRFDVIVRGSQRAEVHETAGRGVGVRRQWIVVDTVPERPDIPAQRIKLEVASVPSHTRMVRRLVLHYQGLPASYGMVLAVCETPTEILADKLVSFANTGAYVRYRDLWDIPWIMSQPQVDLTRAGHLARLKHQDYGCSLSIEDLAEHGSALACDAIRSGAFRLEMERFLPGDVIERTVERPAYLELMADDIARAYDAFRTGQ